MEDTINSLKDLHTGEAGPQQDASSVAASSQSKSSADDLSHATINATCCHDEEMLDTVQQPFFVLNTPSSEAFSEYDGAGTVGRDIGGNNKDAQSLSGSRSDAMEVGNTITPLGPFNPEANAADKKLFATIRSLGRVPHLLHHSPDGPATTYRVTLTWAMNRIGPFEFEHDSLGPRKVLRKDSDLRVRGLAAGLNQEMLEWLTDSSALDTRVFDGGMFNLVGKSAMDGYNLAWECRKHN